MRPTHSSVAITGYCYAYCYCYCRIRAGQNEYSSTYKARVYYLLPVLSCPLSPVLVSRRIQARRRQALGQEEPRISLISPCMISEGVWSKAIQFNSVNLTSDKKIYPPSSFLPLPLPTTTTFPTPDGRVVCSANFDDIP